MNQNIPTLSVSEISFFIKDSLENAFPVIKIIGEISNFSKHASSGHLYFSLKDSESLIKIICFKEQAKKIPFELEDGMKVTITGKLSVYVKSSNYQIIANEVEKSGVGGLAKILEELKMKLSKEGLFDEKHKKPLPFLPSKIGLITSEGGAVLHDILKTLEARFPREILLFPSIMQGIKTAKSVISGIKYFNKMDEVDVIIIARGGGSFEDLFEFNNEELVREVFKSKIPIISAIGHETDFCLLDFAADKRAATPTASVILTVPSRQELLQSLEKKMETAIYYFKSNIEKKEGKLQDIISNFLNLKNNFENKIFIIEKKFNDVLRGAENTISGKEKLLEKQMSEILFYDFTEVLSRGFSIATNKKGERISSIKDVTHGERIEITVADGSIETEVLKETFF
jgi:exodeoxyribonuclease VII large subunit